MSSLPPPPYTAPVMDESTGGLMTAIWSDWIKKAFVRMGGSIAPTNNDPITTSRIQDLAVTTAKIAASAVTEAKIATSAAGSGLSGGAGTPLSVQVDNSTLEINSNALRQKDGGTTFAKLLATDWTKSAASSGYQKIGSGIYIQWGVTGSIASGTNTAQTFPIAFPTNCFQVVATMKANSAEVTTATGHWGVDSYSTTGFTLNNRTSVTGVFSYIAVGN